MTTTDTAPAPADPPPGHAVPPPQVWPSVHATDARALVRFLADALGFELVVLYADGEGDGDPVAHAELAWPEGGGVMLGSARSGAFSRTPGTGGAYLVTDDPDGLHARAVAAGADVVVGLHDTDYGSRDFAVRDPEGNLWSIGTYRGAARPQPRSRAAAG